MRLFTCSYFLEQTEDANATDDRDHRSVEEMTHNITEFFDVSHDGLVVSQAQNRFTDPVCVTNEDHDRRSFEILLEFV